MKSNLLSPLVKTFRAWISVSSRSSTRVLSVFRGREDRGRPFGFRARRKRSGQLVPAPALRGEEAAAGSVEYSRLMPVEVAEVRSEGIVVVLVPEGAV